MLDLLDKLLTFFPVVAMAALGAVTAVKGWLSHRQHSPGVSVEIGAELPVEFEGPTSAERRDALVEAILEALGRTDDEEPGRIVSTGLARPELPLQPSSRDRCLEPGRAYLFWFAIEATPVEGALDDVPRALRLPDEAVAGDAITVALFDYPGELILTPGTNVGTLTLGSDGRITPGRPPTVGLAAPDRLLFPIRTPEEPGIHRLRCNVYCRGTLLQSRVLSVTVEAGAAEREDALQVVVDYAVDTDFEPAALAQIQPLQLSVFANNNGRGTHSFRFFGGEALTATVSVSEHQIQDHIDRARRTLTTVAWGAPEYRDGAGFKYGRPRTARSFSDDLIQLAISGHRLWAHVAGRVADGAAPALPDVSRSRIKELQDLMRRPGMVEFANKVDASFTVPAGLFYDYDLDTTVPVREWRVCPEALDAIRTGADLSRQPCFLGAVEHAETVVCPSGFWGFRHGVTLPQASAFSVGDAAGVAPSADVEATHFIDAEERPRMILGVADDFTDLGGHVAWVEALGGAGFVHRCTTAGRLLEAMRDTALEPHLVYLFCHGSETNGIPALVVGPRKSLGIQYEQIATGNVYWRRSRPLVVLNGCGTTAVQPRHAMNFVDAFIRTAKASGVVGTEITTDARLGARFGQQFLDAFVTGRRTIAESLLSARLSLLAEGDPLGLAFVAYAAPQLRLRARADPCTCGSGRAYGDCHAPVPAASGRG
ncbi:SEC-C domain-containing protein [Actinoplanes friuliensis]|uniref:CHAT domain-containing protein n=1 Tax=Actinoplanes friuliensis DSM 7358 TaxID=1246995 RepID=U5W1P0_9ACTN|nr:SEC-C domain-containing protein [Actinoplanes friuliensis]AGZ42942.1 hypothetical protein AFR_23360 [Actinoplanes friuliensis DSM 7358]